MSKNGTVVEDPRTNSLIVTDEESQFPNIEAMLAKLDVPVPQILIQVEMLDVSKRTSDLIGLQFANTPFDLDATTAGYSIGSFDKTNLSKALDFLRTQTDTKSLARPQIMTLNNQTAEIKISTNEAVGATTRTDAGQGTSSQSVQAERVDTGVFLTVTPQANLLTGEITMAIYPKVIEAKNGIVVDGQQFKDPEERGTQSLLKVKNGQTVVIGGLLREDTSVAVTKVPILGDIPFIGAAFRHKDSSKNNRELMIFLTPRIMDDKFMSGSSRRKKDPFKDGKDSDKMNAINRALSNMEQRNY